MLKAGIQFQGKYGIGFYFQNIYRMGVKQCKEDGCKVELLKAILT